MRTALLAFPALLLACGGTTEHPSPPVEQTYQMKFPSQQAAVGAKTAQVFVFDASVADNDCATLLTKRKTKSALPAPFAATGLMPMCEVFHAAQTAGGKSELPAIPFGRFSFLAVTQDGGRDYFVGCTTATVAADGTPVAISLAPADLTVTVPQTACTLESKCGGSCT